MYLPENRCFSCKQQTIASSSSSSAAAAAAAAAKDSNGITHGSELSSKFKLTFMLLNACLKLYV